jgi:hypothetical protein
MHSCRTDFYQETEIERNSLKQIYTSDILQTDVLNELNQNLLTLKIYQVYYALSYKKTVSWWRARFRLFKTLNIFIHVILFKKL